MNTLPSELGAARGWRSATRHLFFGNQEPGKDVWSAGCVVGEGIENSLNNI